MNRISLVVVLAGLWLWSVAASAQPTTYPDSLLLRAAAFGSEETVLDALAAGANVAARGEHGRTALEMAAEQGEDAVVDALLSDSGARPRQEMDRALVRAVRAAVVVRAAARVDMMSNITLMRTGGQRVSVHIDREEPPFVLTVTPESETTYLRVIHRLLEAGAAPNRLGFADYRAVLLGTLDGAGLGHIVEGTESELSALEIAQRGGASEIAALLERFGGKPSMAPAAVVRRATQRIARAVEANDVEGARAAIEAGADPNDLGERGQTPLQVASALGNDEVVALLADLGAELDRPDSSGSTPLMAAASAGRLGTISYLLSRGARIDAATERGMTALHVAVKAGDTTVVERLVNAGAALSPDVDGLTPLHLAADAGSDAVTIQLLQAGARVDDATKHGETALMMASRAGHASVARLLLQAGADVRRRDTGGASALTRAVRAGDADMVEILLEGGADPSTHDANGTDVLLIASLNGNARIVELLIEAGADPNAGRGTEHSVLISAVRARQSGIVPTLIEHGASPDHRLPDGRTALHVAAETGQSFGVNVLIRGGAPLDVVDAEGETPLIAAASEGHSDPVAMLVDAGADLEKQDGRGNTPLMAAAAARCDSCVRALMQRGARSSPRNHAGQTAIDVARQNGATGVLRTLRWMRGKRFTVLTAGINLSRLRDESNGYTPGVDVGVGPSIRLGDRLALLAEASFSVRGSDVSEFPAVEGAPRASGDYYYELYQVSGLATLRYDLSRHVGARPYVVAGGGLRSTMGAELRDWSGDEEPQDVSEAVDSIVPIFTGGLGYEVLVGSWFVGLEFRYMRGLPSKLHVFDAAMDSYSLALTFGR